MVIFGLDKQLYISKKELNFAKILTFEVQIGDV